MKEKSSENIKKHQPLTEFLASYKPNIDKRFHYNVSCVSICKTNIANVKLRENKLVYRKLYKIVSAALNNTKHKSPSKANSSKCKLLVRYNIFLVKLSVGLGLSIMK